MLKGEAEWLPNVVARRSPQPQVIQLVVKMEVRRSRRILLSFFEPLPPVPIRKPHIYKNTIAEALKIKEFINNGPGRITWAKTCKELHLSESKLAHLLKIVNKLPSEFIENMKLCDDQEKLRIFTGCRLLRISRIKNESPRAEARGFILLGTIWSWLPCLQPDVIFHGLFI